MEPIDHPASRYATDVIEGKIIAGDLVRKACERHLMDLETGRDRGLYFDCQAANAILKFSKLIKHTVGREFAGKQLELRPWQQFRHCSVFGWKREGGLRRFLKTYHQVGKKNGKTTDTAIPALYTQLFDGEAAPQGYCAATSRDQAGLLFQEMKRMIAKSPKLATYLQIQKHGILANVTGGSITCLSRDGNSADGINPHFAALDEVHRWTDRELYDILVNSMIARAQPIQWAITTAGADRQTICGEIRDYSETVLNGDVQDDEFFAYVAEPPQDCDPGDPEAWAMGNPNLGVSIMRARIEQLYKEASVIKGRMPNFRRLHLNVWTEGTQNWIDREIWDRGKQPFELDMLRGKRAFAAFDLSMTTDLSALAIAVPHRNQVFLVVYTFLPTGKMSFAERAQKENRSFFQWKKDGYLEVHGNSIDQDEIFNRLLWARDFFDLQEVSFDRWNSAELVKMLNRAHFNCLEFDQSIGKMSKATKVFEDLIVNGRLRHGGNPVLAWAMGNVHLIIDANENIKPHKQKSTSRIDPVIASIMAAHRAIVAEEKLRPQEIVFA